MTWATWPRRLAALLLAGAAWLGGTPHAQAHLMVAQRGTLNLVGDGGFAVMAIPVGALQGIDDDGDGRLSVAELRAHAGTIEKQVQRGLQLIDRNEPRPLQGLMLNLSPDDSASTAPAAHLVVLGRFALADASPKAVRQLRLRFDMFGKTAETQQQTITVTQGAEVQMMVLRPGRTESALLPSPWAVLRDSAALGATHVLGGLDHLLFLLVVLATGWAWRSALLALTCFTAGHATTLAAVALGGLTAPAHLVEPAIAATIVGMALFDRWSRQRPQPLAAGWRLVLVFGCALIHGLGLAGALSPLGLDPANRLLSLLGFNAGIEAAQLGVAFLAGAVMATLRHLRGPTAVALATRGASYTAIVAGSAWLAERAMAG